MDWLLALLLALQGMTTMTAERVVLRRASTELACPSAALAPSCNHGGAVFHLALQVRCQVRGCGEEITYRCETPLRRLGGVEVRYPTVCE